MNNNVLTADVSAKVSLVENIAKTLAKCLDCKKYLLLLQM